MTNVRESKNPLPPTPLAALREWARTVLYPDGSLAAFAVRTEDHRQNISVWFSADGSVWDGPAPLVVLPKGMGLWGGVEAESLPFYIGLTDHFSPPFDQEDRFHNLFNLCLDDDVKAEGWHKLSLAWDMTERKCRIELDGQPLSPLILLHESPGPCYLRLRVEKEVGIFVESIRVELEGKGMKNEKCKANCVVSVNS